MRAAIVAEARRWIGTPYVHQARERGVGTDCAGLVIGVAMALGIIDADWPRRNAHLGIGDHARQPSGGALQALCERFMFRVTHARDGDVLLLRFRREPQHMGICVGDGMVHALHGFGVRKVVEHRLGETWLRRIVAVYRMPGVE